MGMQFQPLRFPTPEKTSGAGSKPGPLFTGGGEDKNGCYIWMIHHPLLEYCIELLQKAICDVVKVTTLLLGIIEDNVHPQCLE